MLIFSNQKEIDGLFLVFLSIMSSYTFNIISCPTQKLLNNSLISRHIIFLLVVMFSTTVLSDDIINPIYHFIKSFFIYIFLIISTKISTNLTITIFALFIILYIVHMYRYFYINKYDTISNAKERLQYKGYIDLIHSLNNILIILIFIITLYGFIQFNIVKRKQYGKNFDFIKFIFGIRACK